VIEAGVDVWHPLRRTGIVPTAARIQITGDRIDPDLSRLRRTSGACSVAGWSNSGVSQLQGIFQKTQHRAVGTDVGFTTIYDTSIEYELMHRALSERQILASSRRILRFISRLRRGQGRSGV